MINKRLNKIEKLFLNSIQTKELIVKDKLFNSLAVMGELATNSIIDGGKALVYCDEFFLVSSMDTGRIQEAHITAGHALMEYIEDELLECGHINLQNKL